MYVLSFAINKFDKNFAIFIHDNLAVLTSHCLDCMEKNQSLCFQYRICWSQSCWSWYDVESMFIMHNPCYSCLDIALIIRCIWSYHAWFSRMWCNTIIMHFVNVILRVFCPQILSIYLFVYVCFAFSASLLSHGDILLNIKSF